MAPNRLGKCGVPILIGSDRKAHNNSFARVEVVETLSPQPWKVARPMLETAADTPRITHTRSERQQAVRQSRLQSKFALYLSWKSGGASGKSGSIVVASNYRHEQIRALGLTAGQFQHTRREAASTHARFLAAILLGVLPICGFLAMSVSVMAQKARCLTCRSTLRLFPTSTTNSIESKRYIDPDQ